MIARARYAAFAGLALASAFAGPASAAVAALTPEAQPFRVGSLEVVALHDADNVMPNDGKIFGVGAGVGPTAVARVLKDAGAPIDTITLSVDALLVKAPDRMMLFDTGLGPGVKGALMGSLAKAGVAPDAVTDVFITHSHGDHIGGLVTADGKPAFPKATIHLSAPEWDWMRTQPKAEAVAKAIATAVKTFAPGAEVVPGVTALALPGHTPGHAGYEIASGTERLTDIGDTAHSSILSLAEPDWAMGYDNDEAQGETTRRATLQRLADQGSLLFAPHFPFPGIGRIVATGGHFAWKPATP